VKEVFLEVSKCNCLEIDVTVSASPVMCQDGKRVASSTNLLSDRASCICFFIR
jgi:hypothetical protein